MGVLAEGILRGCQDLFTPLSLGYPLSVFNKKLSKTRGHNHRGETSPSGRAAATPKNWRAAAPTRFVFVVAATCTHTGPGGGGEGVRKWEDLLTCLYVYVCPVYLCVCELCPWCMYVCVCHGPCHFLRFFLRVCVRVYVVFDSLRDLA